MANSTVKPASNLSSENVLRSAHNEVNASLSTDGFLVGKVGRRIQLVISTTTIANDTEAYTFIEDGVTLYVITVIYTDGTRETLLSAERTA